MVPLFLIALCFAIEGTEWACKYAYTWCKSAVDLAYTTACVYLNCMYNILTVIQYLKRIKHIFFSDSKLPSVAFTAALSMTTTVRPLRLLSIFTLDELGRGL